MKKIINEPNNFVEESIEGLVKSHPDIYAFTTLKLNSDLRKYLFALNECPFWNK